MDYNERPILDCLQNIYTYYHVYIMIRSTAFYAGNLGRCECQNFENKCEYEKITMLIKIRGSISQDESLLVYKFFVMRTDKQQYWWGQSSQSPIATHPIVEWERAMQFTYIVSTFRAMVVYCTLNSHCSRFVSESSVSVSVWGRPADFSV